MSETLLFGASYSVYVRIVRLALHEKGVPYRLIEVDVFGDPAARAAQAERHPFGKIPAFEHAGFRLYETAAITRYVDEAFAGPPLQPASPAARARMMQAISILDSYAYRALVWDIAVERVERPKMGKPADEARIAAALPMARTCLRALADLAPGEPMLAGPTLTLADLHAAPMIGYVLRAPEGAPLLGEQARLLDWWQAMSHRRSMLETPFP